VVPRGGIIAVVRKPEPGLLVVWSGDVPCLLPFRIPARGLVVGRELFGPGGTDDRISRRHARVGASGSAFVVTDLGSRNGTYAGGQAIVDREITVTAPCVLRTGRTVAVIVPDITGYEGQTVKVEGGQVWGPSTAASTAVAAAAAREDQNLVVIGEPGSGKRAVADAYLAHRQGSHVVIDGAAGAVPKTLPKGTTTIVLEQPQAMPTAAQTALAALLGERTAIRVVTLAIGDLERLVDLDPELATLLAGRVVRLPPLRERAGEIAHLVAATVREAEPNLAVHSTLIESCLLRPWPGNVRELRSEVTRAAHAVAGANKPTLRGEDLEPEAGHLLAGAPTLNHAVHQTIPGNEHRRRRRASTKTGVD
jgi:transcriptional regulator of acetoin/glycerol metabolism